MTMARPRLNAPPAESTMTWEQKLAACQALGDCSVRMRKPGDWYVDHLAVDIGTPGGMLEGRYGNGGTPEEAVEHHWLQLTTLAKGERIIIRPTDGGRREVRWNGFMWQDWGSDTYSAGYSPDGRD